jgi:predicted kinase
MGSFGALHFLIGPVGAGKTTYARQKIARTPAVLLDCDMWMVRLFGADQRPQENVIAWYLERREQCRSSLWELALEVLRCGTSVYLELGLVTQIERESFYTKATDEGIDPNICLLDADRAVRRDRVMRRNQSGGALTQIVPIEFFERASDAWQSPSEEERRTWNILEI